LATSSILFRDNEDNTSKTCSLLKVKNFKTKVVPLKKTKIVFNKIYIFVFQSWLLTREIQDVATARSSLSQTQTTYEANITKLSLEENLFKVKLNDRSFRNVVKSITLLLLSKRIWRMSASYQNISKSLA